MSFSVIRSFVPLIGFLAVVGWAPVPAQPTSTQVVTSVSGLLPEFAAVSIQAHGDGTLPPMPKDRNWHFQMGDDTGSVKFFLDMKGVCVPTGKQFEAMVTSCDNECKGGVHVRHSDCDFKCDKQCTQGVHKITLDPGNTRNYDFEKGMDADIDADNKKFASGVGSKALQEEAHSFINWSTADLGGAAMGTTYEWKCWNKRPCSVSNRSIFFEKVVLRFTYTLVREETTDTGKVNTVKGPSRTVDTIVFNIPVRDKWFDYAHDACRCEILLHDKNDETGYHVGDGPAYAGGVFVDDKPISTPVSSIVLQQVNFNVVCEDMNNVVCTATNTTDKEIDFCIEPGTCFGPEDDGCQTMVLLNMIKMALPPKASSVVRLPIAGLRTLSGSSSRSGGSSFGAPVQAKGYLACLNMHKKMPEPGVKYSLAPNPDCRIRQLATAGAGDHFRGSSTQVKYWIITDHATMAQVNDIMIPGVSAAGYVDAMYDVARFAHVDFLSPEFVQCASPDLLVGGSHDSTLWFCQLLARRDAKGLAQWMDTHSGDFNKLFAADAKPWDLEHAADLVQGLSESGNPDLQLSALNFLMTVVPEGKRADVVAKKGTRDLPSLLFSSDAKVAGRALDVVEAFKLKDYALNAGNLDPALPADLIARGKAVAKALGTP